MIMRSLAILALILTSSFAHAQKAKKAQPPPPQQKPLPSGTILRPPEVVDATFVLHGIPGAGQTSIYSVYTYAKRDNGTLIKYSRTDAGTCELEKPCAVHPGSYLFQYSHTNAFFEIVAGQPNELSLQRFVAPKIDGKTSFRIFVDLTNPEEQKKQLKAMILNRAYAHPVEYSPMNSWIGNYVKPVFDSGKIETASQTLTNALFDFGGALCEMSSGGLGNLTGDCYYVWADDDPADGNFVSVMPGTYGVVWTMPSGQYRYQYGQVPQL